MNRHYNPLNGGYVMVFRPKKKMCADCKSIATVRCTAPSKCMYIALLEYVKALVATEKYALISSTHPIDRVIDSDGYWADDLIGHTIQCKTCCTCFTCVADTYHGRFVFDINNT